MKTNPFLVLLLGAVAVGCAVPTPRAPHENGPTGGPSAASPQNSQPSSADALQVVALQQERQQLLATLDAFHERIRDLESRLADREGKPIAKSYDELLAIKEAEVQELRQTSAEHVAVVAQRDAAAAELTQAKQRLSALDQQLVKKDQELASLRGLAVTAAELDAAKRRVAELEATLIQRDTDIRALRASAAERGTLVTQLQTATVTLNHTKERLVGIEKQLAQKDQDLRTNVAEKQRLSAESASYANDLKLARQRIALLEQQATDSEQQFQIMKRSSGDRDRVAGQLAASNMDLTQMKQRASQLERQLAAKVQETETLRSLVTEKDALLRHVGLPKEAARRPAASSLAPNAGSQVAAFNRTPSLRPAPSRSADQPYAKLSQTKDELARTFQNDMARGTITLKQEGNQLSVSLSSSVLFASEDVNLKPEATAVLQRIGQIIGQASNRAVQVTGHTDNQEISKELRKTFPDNRALSWARADSARKALISGGTPPEHIRAIGLAGKKPLASNTTEAGRQKNRRIEIVVTQFSTPARTMTTGSAGKGPSMAALSTPGPHEIP
jgi:flagellar motor protein MotB